MNRNPYTYHAKAIGIGIAIWEVIFAVGFVWIYQYFMDKSSFRFEYEWILYGLILVPIFSLIIFFNVIWQNKAVNRFATDDHRKLTLPKKSSFVRYLHWFLRRNALAFLIIALSNPQFGKDKLEGQSKGIEIVFALDVSNSMLAEDLVANRSRLSIAKKSIGRFVNQLHGDKVGLLVFAGSSYILTPLTTDYGTFTNTLQEVTPKYVSNQGTAISSAIATSIEHLDFKNGVKKAIVVVSDGETHDGNALELAKQANGKGVQIFTIGAGTKKGAPIPEYRNGRKTGYKKKKNGETVLTRINPQMLSDIATAGGGKYEQVQGAQINFEGLLSQINEIEKTTVDAASYYNYIDRYKLFLIIGVILLIVDQFLPRLMQILIHNVIEGKEDE